MEYMYTEIVEAVQVRFLNGEWNTNEWKELAAYYGYSSRVVDDFVKFAGDSNHFRAHEGEYIVFNTTIGGYSISESDFMKKFKKVEK